jgi:hypothetical protein
MGDVGKKVSFSYDRVVKNPSANARWLIHDPRSGKPPFLFDHINAGFAVAATANQYDLFFHIEAQR